MNFFGYLVLAGYVPFVLLLYQVTTPRRACLAAYMTAGMFLPMAGLHLSGLPPYDKTSAPSFAVLLATLLFHNDYFRRFRFSWWDLPALVFGCAPFMSSVTNKLGAYDGFSTVATWWLIWLLPYLVGRVYFQTLDDAREIAGAIMIGALIYLPFCWWEIRMSPQLHRMVYGFDSGGFITERRGDSFRPVVFMQHGLEVAMFITTGSLCAISFWMNGSVKRVGLMSIGFACVILAGTEYLCHSLGAAIMLAVGTLTLLTIYKYRSRFLLILIVLVPPAYMVARGTELVTGQWMIEQVRLHVNQDRAFSLETRINSERIFVAHALQKPWFGWGSYDWYPMRPDGKPMGIPDGMWIICMARSGLVCLISGTVMLLLPAVLLIFKVPRQYLSAPAMLPMIALVLIAALHMCDNLMNAMELPIYLVGAGCAMSLLTRPRFYLAAIPGMARGMAAPQRQQPEGVWRPDGSSVFAPPPVSAAPVPATPVPMAPGFALQPGMASPRPTTPGNLWRPDGSSILAPPTPTPRV